MIGTLILPDFLIDLPGEPPKQGWGVRVEADQIAAVAPNADLRQAYPEDEVVEASGQTLRPVSWMRTPTCTASSPTASLSIKPLPVSGRFSPISGGRWWKTGSTMR